MLGVEGEEDAKIMSSEFAVVFENFQMVMFSSSMIVLVIAIVVEALVVVNIIIIDLLPGGPKPF